MKLTQTKNCLSVEPELLDLTFRKFTVSHSEFSKHFHLLKKLKCDFTRCYFFILSNMRLGVGMPHGFGSVYPGGEGGIQVLGGATPSSRTVGAFFRTLVGKNG
jgi:hypothetical protein